MSTALNTQPAGFVHLLHTAVRGAGIFAVTALKVVFLGRNGID